MCLGAGFRFQTGSIKRFLMQKAMTKLLCFDSKLVRLKGLLLPVMVGRDGVSIPNWFD